jgi:serine/threonine-protein kinase
MAATLQPGVAVGDYILQERVGDTSCGELFRGVRATDQQAVRVELLTGIAGDDAETRSRVLRELAIVSALAHPNILPCLGCGEIDDIVYKVEPELPGHPFSAYLESGAVPEEAALCCAHGVASGMRHAWEQDEVVHRDIKPGNLFVHGDGTPLLTGFSIARAGDSDHQLTAPGYTLGTPEYMSPEQIHADVSLDFRADMYSLGCLLYEALTGCVPFADAAPLLVMQQQLDHPHRPLQEAQPQASEQAAAIVDRLLAKSPDDRFVSWDALIAALDLSLDGPADGGKPNESVIELTSSRQAEWSRTSVASAVAPPPPVEPALAEAVTVVDSRERTPAAAVSGVAGIGSTRFPQSLFTQLSGGDFVPLTGFAAEKYAIEQDIAAGGMGRIVRARDNDLGREVAMKTILPHLRSSPKLMARFVEEARTVGQLEHPNIVPVYDIGIDAEGEVYFTMKLIRGRTLEAVIADLRQGDAETHAHYTWSRRAGIIQQICDAVQYAHTHGVLHRDLKPANIMIGPFGEVVVMDWGLAKYTREPDAGDQISAELRKAAAIEKGIVGTPNYMSPEQAQNQDDTLAPASDIYAIGVIMYELFGLAPPHTGDNMYKLLMAIVNDEPPALSEQSGTGQGAVPIEVDYISRKALAKPPDERHQTATELRDELQLYLEGRYPIVCPHTALKRGVMEVAHLVDAHAKLLIIGILLLVMLAVLGGVAALAS